MAYLTFLIRVCGNYSYTGIVYVKTLKTSLRAWREADVRQYTRVLDWFVANSGAVDI